MPTDHPDGIRPIDFSGATIKVPIDIQAQLITLDIDIVAQTVGNIAIDIAAQTIGNLNIDIAEVSAGVLNINISTQSIDLNIDIEAQSVGIYLQPEWATKEGIHKSDHVGAGAVAAGSTPYSDYVVTTGKTLYIILLSGTVYLDPPADKPDNAPMAVGITNTTTGTEHFRIGGNGGCGISLLSPIKIPSGNNIRIHAYNHCAFQANYITAWWVGYEI